MPSILPNKGDSLAINMQAGALLDGYTLTTFDTHAIGDIITGQINDLPFSFMVEKTAPDKDGKITVSGAYDVDILLTKPLSYSPPSDFASDVLASMATVLEKTLVIHTDDHAAIKINESKPTPKDVISNLYDWTSKIPHQRVNVFIREDTIYAIQRGQELGVVDIVDWDGPSVPTRQKLRTLQNSVDTDNNNVPGQVSGSTLTSTTYLTGTFTYGDDSYEYLNGLVVSESHTVNTETTTTEFTYSSLTPPAQITGKVVTNPDATTIETSYTYNSDGYLTREIEIKYDATHTATETRTTVYAPKGQGFWSVDVFVDGELAASNLQNGTPPSGNASVQSIVTYSGDSASSDNSATTSGRYVGDNYIPVCDGTTLLRFAAGLEYLNGKIEERLPITVYDESILDFTHRYNLLGVVWYLESNRISRTPDSFTQNVELIRWV